MDISTPIIINFDMIYRMGEIIVAVKFYFRDSGENLYCVLVIEE